MDGLLPFFRDSDDLKPLEFGEEPNSEGGNSIPDEDIYDAVNDETFGAEISSIATNDADLEGFSTRTANLALFDEPGCSIQLPDPSQIPIPIQQMGDDFDKGEKENKHCGVNESLSSIWASGSFNGIGSLTESYIGQLKTEFQNASRDEQKQQLQRMLEAGLASINHLLIDDSNQIANKNCHTMVSANTVTERQEVLQKIPTTSGLSSNKTVPLSVEELERRMLVEAASIAVHQHQTNQYQLHNPTTEIASLPINQSKQQSLYCAASGALNPLFLPPQRFLQQMQQISQSYQMAAIAAAADGLPPPPIPPLPLLSHPAMTLPPAVVPPMTTIGSLQYHDATPAAALLQAPTSNYNYRHLSPVTTGTSSLKPQLTMIPSSLHPRVEGKPRQRQNGLPSGKTISDFALDPYAGFMSTKEREWLIKIHIIQCLGSGDPLEDDFYYTVWKQKNILQKAPEQWRNKENPKYYKFEATFPSAGYTAPSFLGSLGKPIHSSASQPRQIIEVTSDNTDEDLSLSKNRQKRLRAALLKIENGSIALLDCQNIRRKLRFFEETRITEYLDQCEITGRTARFAENLAHVDISLFSMDVLATMMLIQKGRRCIYDWLKFLSEESNDEIAFNYLRRLMLIIPKFAKKMPEEALKQFGDVVCNCFVDLPLDKVLELLRCTAKWELSLISDSKMVQLTLLALIWAAVINSGCNLHLDVFQGTGAAHFLHSVPVSALKLQLSTNADFELFKSSKWAQLRQWLIREQSRGHVLFNTGGTIARWIVQNQSFILI